MVRDIDAGQAQREIGIVAIVRLRHRPAPAQMWSTLEAAGIERAEITLPSPRALETIAEISASSGMLVGAGTVRTVADVRSAVAAGARFLVTPILDLDLLDAAAGLDVPVYCGAATPTEIERAHRHPAVVAVKVFPAGALGGRRYIAAIREPLDDVPLLPTGGVGAAEAREYAALGCVGVGVGGALVNDTVVAERAWPALHASATGLVAAWADGRRDGMTAHTVPEVRP